MSKPDIQEKTSLLMSKINAYRISQAIYIAAKLGISKKLAKKQKSAGELADLCGVQPGRLYQVLRALAAEGIYTEDDQGRFSNTPMSEYLTEDAPGPFWANAIMVGERYYEAFGALMHSVQSGEAAFEKIHGESFYDNLSCHPDVGRIFDSMMTALYAGDIEYLLGLYDFSRFGRILDVGGGRGTFIRGLLSRGVTRECGLFDLPAVSERTRKEFTRDGLVDNCEIISGSFLDGLPKGFDTYLFKSILHNWSDNSVDTILRQCRAACGPDSRIAIVEYIVPHGNEPSFAKGLDLTMLALFGGKERSLKEFEALLRAARFELDEFVPPSTPAGMGLVVGNPTL